MMAKFEYCIRDVVGDVIVISTDVRDDLRVEHGAAATIEIRCTGESVPVVALDRDGLIAVRSAIDSFLAAIEARELAIKNQST